MKGFGIAGLALALLTPSVAAGAGESVNLILNWAPTADHSPFYYAKAQGWYEKAGIDLTIETGKGSGVSSLKVGSGGSPFGIADLATMLVAKSKGADVVALMSIYANTGQTFYWLKSYGVNGPKDFVGHKALSGFCKKNMGIFRYIIGKLEDDPQERQILESWVNW